MGKTSKPRLNFTLTEENKAFVEEWAESDGRTVANLVERIVVEAINRKKQNSPIQSQPPV